MVQFLGEDSSDRNCIRRMYLDTDSPEKGIILLPKADAFTPEYQWELHKSLNPRKSVLSVSMVGEIVLAISIESCDPDRHSYVQRLTIEQIIVVG